MKIHIIHTRALTNLQVGSGEANYSVIDNLVQKDTLTNLPTIHGSSFKGAIRQHLDANGLNTIELLGGEDASEKGKTLPSKISCLSSELVALAVRSHNDRLTVAVCPYYLRLFDTRIKEMSANLNFGDILDQNPTSGQPIVFRKNIHGFMVEDFRSGFVFKEGKSAGFIDSDIHTVVCFSKEDFDKLAAEEYLPVIARNKVKKTIKDENGEWKTISGNLWYEQVVPRESQFITPIIDHSKEEWIDNITGDHIIHIGANATVGYGFCKLKKLN